MKTSLHPTSRADALNRLQHSQIGLPVSSSDEAENFITHRKSKLWLFIVAFLLFGYLSMNRSFAYLGIPPLKLFIGELVLGAFLLTRPQALFGNWASALLNILPLSGVAWTLYLFLAYGILQFLRGIATGHPPFTAIQNLIFNIYPLYLFLGVWIGLQYPTFLPKFFRLFAWWHGLYGIVYILILDRVPWIIPGSSLEVPVFSAPTGSGVALLGLFSFEPKLIRVWFLLLLNACVMLGIQLRSEWLGFSVGLLVLSLFGKQMRRVLKGVGIVVVLLSLGYITDFSLPATSTRGGEISTRGIVGRVIAPLDPKLAAKYTEHSETFVDTVSWRTTWWQAIWDSVHEDETRSFLGHGYGFQLSSLVPYLEDRPDVRTPHNVFYYALGYGGWIGVALFFALQFCLARLLWSAYRLTNQPFGIAFWAMSLTWALFDNFLENPFRAIPFYLLIGLAIAPALSRKETRAQLAGR